MSKRELLEKRLNDLRTTESKARAELATLVDQEDDLNQQREQLAFAAVSGDEQAQQALKSIKRGKFDLRNDREDLQAGLARLETEIIRTQQDLEITLRDEKLDDLRALMAERGRIAEEIEKQMAALNSEIARYNKKADEFTALAAELELPNRSTRGMLGAILKDFIRSRLSAIFPEVGYLQESQRIALTDAERSAREALEFSISGARKAA